MATDPVGMVVNPIVSKGLDKALKVIAYVWKYHDYIDHLETDDEGLSSKLRDVKREVNDALSCRQEIKHQVQRWMENSEAKLSDTRDFLDSLDSPASCNLNYSYKRRYNVATRAETLSREIKTLVENGQFEGRVYFEPSKPPPLAPTLAAGYVALASREKYLERLKDSLRLGGSEEKLVMGIYGLEGAGKTMLANKLAAEIESEQLFDVVVPVTSGASKEGVLYIQQEIAERIGLRLTVQTLQERMRWLHDRLTHIGEVLIIIDNVDKWIDLNQIGIPCPEPHNGCRIVVVSRSLNVCKMMKTQMNLKVEPLPQDESLNLVDELAKGYNFAGTSILQNARDSISSKQAWLPSEIDAHIRTFYSKHLQATKSIASNRGGNRSFVLDADALQIEHVEKANYWKLSRNPSTSSKEATLIKVWFLHIEGKVREEWLWPGTYYGAYFVYKLNLNAEGFKTNQMELIVGSNYKKCYLDPSIAICLHRQERIGDADVPKSREDDWLEIEMGRFYNDAYSNPEVELVVKDHNTEFYKSGLRIRGIELRPLDTR